MTISELIAALEHARNQAGGETEIMVRRINYEGDIQEEDIVDVRMESSFLRESTVAIIKI